MKNERPKIKVPFQQIDIIIELINITLLILIIAYTLMNYSELPETIATHFNGKGEADGFSNKATIWILAGLALFTYVLLFFINKIPHLHNYMVNITEENALKNYRLSTRLVRYTNTFCLILFGVILYDIIGMSKGGEAQIIGIPFLIATIFVPIIGVALVFYYQKKINS